MNTQGGFTGTAAIGIAIFLIVLSGGVYLYKSQDSVSEEVFSCPADAMLCPDGSAVGRVGPNCEFAECPDKVGTPDFIQEMCQSDREKKFVTSDGYNVVFRDAYSVLRCRGGSVWAIDEGSLPEGATFYFDNTGSFLDVCQLIHRPEGCQQFGDIFPLGENCEERNYCT